MGLQILGIKQIILVLNTDISSKNLIRYMLPVDSAIAAILENLSAWDKTTSISPQQSVGCVLAENITAKRDIPCFNNSAMDGFVLRKEDWDKGQRSFPVAFEIRPENKQPKSVPYGQCARIMTGAVIPENGDQVIPVEMSEEENNKATFSGLPNRNPIRLQGEGYEKGKSILKKGRFIRPYEMGLMIESGSSDCTVFKPLRIALQVTGSEVDEKMNTNGPVLREIISTWPGVEVKEWPVLKDEPGEVKNRLLSLKEKSDVIITTGGISAGKHDYLYSTMEEFGANFLIRKINQKPGKPFTLSLWDGVPVCNLPGNPVSAVFCAEMYARLIIARMLSIKVIQTEAITSGRLINTGTKTLFVPGLAKIKHCKVNVTAQTRMKSHLLQLYNENNAYLRLDPESKYEPGDKISVIPFSNGSLPWM